MKERLKQLRKALKLTQEKFGKIIGVKTSTVGNWEAGLQPVTDVRIFQICKTFNVSQDWLKSGAGNMFSQEGSDVDARVLGMLKQLTSKQKEALLNFVDSLREKDD